MSLRAKITAAIVGLIAAIGLAGTLHARVTLSTDLRDQLVQRGMTLAKSISSQSEGAVITNDVFGLYEIINGAIINDDDLRYVLILDSQGEVRAKTIPGAVPVGLLEANSWGRERMASVKRLRTNQGPIQDIAYPILGGRLGTVRVGMSELRLEKKVDRFTLQLIGLTAGVTAFALAVSMVLATLLTRPLVKLAAAARAVGRGDLNQTVIARGTDEVARLARAFNAMTEDLARSRREIEEFNQEMLRRSQELSTLNAIAASVSQSLDLSAVMEAALDNVLRLMEADAGGILLWDESATALEYRSYRGLPDDFVAEVSGLKRGEGIAGRVAVTGEPIVVKDITVDERVTRDVVRRLGLHAFASIPLRAKEQIVGVMNVARSDWRAFDERDVQLLIAIGHQVGVAVENARLWEELKQKENARAELLQKVISAQEEERERIARELHDEMAQGLTALVMGLGRLEQTVPEMPPATARLVESVKAFASRALADTRRLILDLRPPVLDDLGLVPAIRLLAEHRLEEQGIAVSIRTEGLENRLPPHLEVTIFRVLQEAISNCARHARAKRVCIGLRIATDNFQVTVQDDGVGFEPSSIFRSAEGKRALGILGMKERAAILGGRLDIHSRPGKGTTVVLEIPLRGMLAKA